MKKLLSILLAMAMVLSLAGPALASSATPDEQAWMDAHAEEVSEFLANLDAYVAALSIGDATTVAELAAALDQDEQVTRNMLLENWVASQMYEEQRQEDLARFREEQPELYAQFKANAYQYFAEFFPWYDSAEEYMELSELTEEEFVDEMTAYQVEDYLAEQRYQAAVDEEKTALGGVPGQLSVMVNGAYVDFPDALPEIHDDRTMVPVRAIVEALGGQVSFDGFVHCVMGDTTITFSPQSPVMHAERGGETVEIQMDCTPYIKDSRTYVPVRFFASAMGCLVGWDAPFQTAVIIDPQPLIAMADGHFSILDRVYAARQAALEGEGNLCQTTEFTMASAPYIQSIPKAVFRSQILSDENGSASGTFSMEMDPILLGVLALSFQSSVTVPAGIPREIKADYIMNGDTAWLRSSLLESLGLESGVWYELTRDQLEELSGGSSLSSAVSQSDVALLSLLTEGSGSAAQAIAVSSLASGMDDVYAWSTAVASIEQAIANLGDDAFTHTEQGDTLAIVSEEDGLSLTLTITDSGTLTAKGGLSGEDGGEVGSIRLTQLTLEGAELHAAFTMILPGSGQLDFTLTQTMALTQDAPLSSPPAGDRVEPFPSSVLTSIE